MTILVDMDDVLEQLVKGWVEYLNERYGIHASPDDITEWNMERNFPTLTAEQVYGAIHEDDLWDHVYPMPGAVEALEKLIREGHQVYVVTATEYQSLRAKMEKVLFRYFPYLSWRQVIITQNKHMIKGDVLIDDGPHNLQGGEYKKILFHATHNSAFDEHTVGAIRVYNWQETYDEVQRIAREAERK